jgi:hypothetical protein
MRWSIHKCAVPSTYFAVRDGVYINVLCRIDYSVKNFRNNFLPQGVLRASGGLIAETADVKVAGRDGNRDAICTEEIDGPGKS